MKERIAEVIEDLEAASRLEDVAGMKPFVGSHFRLRIGEYRLGLTLDGDVVELVRCLHRREIYRFFP